MRKITMLLILCAFVLTGFAQLKAVDTGKVFTNNFQNTLSAKGVTEVTDTLIPASFEGGHPVLYTANAGGYVFGANGYHTTPNAQVFVTSEEKTYKVEGVIFWVGANALSDGNLAVKVWNFVDSTFSTELVSLDVPFAQVTTTTPNESGDFYYAVMFDAPIEVADSFAIGFDVGNKANGFGLMSTKAGDGGVGAWQTYNGNWYNVPALWGLDIDMGLFALVSEKAPKISVTFNVDMNDAGLQNGDTVIVTGNFANWAEPGTDTTCFMTDEDSDGVYSLTVKVDKNFGELKYKYFKNSGWTGGEWEGDPNRTTTVGTDNVILNDTWGSLSISQEALNQVSIYPNPTNDVLNISNLDGVKTVIISNVLGQSILTNNVSDVNMTINISNLKTGIYLVTLVAENGLVRTERIIKE
jgi:hypothetical protein